MSSQKSILARKLRSGASEVTTWRPSGPDAYDNCYWFSSFGIDLRRHEVFNGKLRGWQCICVPSLHAFPEFAWIF